MEFYRDKRNIDIDRLTISTIPAETHREREEEEDDEKSTCLIMPT